MSSPTRLPRAARAIVVSVITWAMPMAAARAQSPSGVTELGASAGVHFLVITGRVAATDESLRRVAHTACLRDRVCAVRFWLSEAHAARALPMTDDQAQHEVASYAINRNTGQDDFTCRPSAARVPPCTSVY
jgi:hypothetical protein